jgi:hypothetical protein
MEQKPIGYCLAIMKSEGVNLIGGELLFSTLLDYIKMPCSDFFLRFCLNHTSDVWGVQRVTPSSFISLIWVPGWSW